MTKLQHLKTFVAVADSGGVRAAARMLGVSQVAASKALKTLENELGEQLFVRSTHGVTITYAGTALMPRARLILEQMSRIAVDMGRISGSSASVGITPFANFFLLKAALANFRRTQPLVQLRLVDGLLSQVVPALRDGSLDFALVASFTADIGDDLVFEPCFVARNAFVVRAGHPLAGKVWPIAQLLEYEWTQNEALDGLHGYLLRWLDSLGLPQPRTIICNSFATLLGVTLSTDSIACAPEILASHPIFQSQLAPLAIDVEVPASTFGFLARRDVPLSKAATQLKICLRRAAAGVTQLVPV